MYYNKFATQHHHHHYHYHQHIGLEWHRFLYKAGLWILMASNILTGLSALMVAAVSPYWGHTGACMMMALLMIGLGLACIPMQQRLHYRKTGAPDQLLILQLASAVMAEMTMVMCFGFITMSLMGGIVLAIINRCYYSKRIRMFKY